MWLVAALGMDEVGFRENISTFHILPSIHSNQPILLTLFCHLYPLYACTHCKEISIYLFPEKELRDLSPNLHIRVSVIDLYNPKIGPSIFLQQTRQTDCGNI